MLVSDIVTRVRNTVGDAEQLQFTDATAMSWINDAQREIAADNQLLQKIATSSPAIGTSTILLPADILKMQSIRYDGSRLEVMSMEDAENRYGLEPAPNDTPWLAYIWAGNLTLYPAPSAVKVLQIYYIRQPADVTTLAQAPEVPIIYHQRIVDYLLAQVAQMDDDMNRYQIKMNEFKTGVASFKDIPEWEGNAYPFVGTTRDGAG